MLKGPADDFEIEMQDKLAEKVDFESRYNFLMGHRGIRARALSGLIGTTGAGKSTLAKCMITEQAAQGKTVLVWLSEETSVQYQSLIRKLDKSALKNLVFVEEQSLDRAAKMDIEIFLETFTQLVEQSGADYIWIDNVTTSCFYNGTFGFHGAARVTEFLMGLAKRVGIFYIAHTDSKVTDNHNRVLTPEDIRGPKNLSLSTEYFYTLQKFTSNEKIFNIIRVYKARFHEHAFGFFALKYEKGSYVGDAKIPFELVNKIFRERDFLGRTPPRAKKDPKDAPQRQATLL